MNELLVSSIDFFRNLPERFLNSAGEGSSVALLTFIILLLPLVSALSSLLLKRQLLRDMAALTFSVLLMYNMLNLFFLTSGMASVLPIFASSFPPFTSLAFQIEPLGLTFALALALFWVLICLYQSGYVPSLKLPESPRYYALSALTLASALGLAFSANLPSFFLFDLALTILTYQLISCHSASGSKIYLICLFGGAFFLLSAVIATSTWQISGRLAFVPGGVGVNHPLLLICFLLGLIKTGLLPVHFWLSRNSKTHEPLLGLLVIVGMAGIFGLIKIFVYIFGLPNLSQLLKPYNMLCYWAGLSSLIAAIFAIRQNVLTSKITYLAISQLSLMVMSASLLLPQAIMAASFLMVVQGLSLLALIFACGVIRAAANQSDISRLKGIGQALPVTMSGFAIASFSLIGLPPMAGVLGKYYLLIGLLQISDWRALLLLALTMLATAASLLPFIYRSFFHTPALTLRIVPPAMIIATAMASIGTIGLFLYPDILLWLGQRLVLP